MRRSWPFGDAEEMHDCLTRLRPGDRGAVAEVLAGCKARCRLASLGLVPGCSFQVVANAGRGPLLLRVGESRVMVERNVANKVRIHRPE
jgi:ferrous iron transport protein A